MTDAAGTLRRIEDALALLAGRQDVATAPVTVAAWEASGEPVPPAEALRQARFQPCPVGSTWGRPWGTTLFRLRGEIPVAWEGHEVEVVLDLGYTPWPPGFQAEGLVIDRAGRPLRGLHPRQQRLVVAAPAGAGEQVEVLVEAAANPSVTSFTRGGADAVNGLAAPPPWRLVRAELALPDKGARELAADLDVLRSLLLVRAWMGTPDERVGEVAAACARACELLQASRREWPWAVAEARTALAPVLARAAPASAPALAVVGHAHLDTAWLWPIRETVRKAIRTYSNVLALMREDAELVFAGTQAAQHDWARTRHPQLWAGIALRAAEGRWVPVGGMWVESDTLLPSGESLARQLIHGQRFFLEHLGRTAGTGWLPDCFGYSPAMPQLLRQAGIGSFVTQKLSWNDTNRFPHRTFWWEGLDGSRVLTHFPTVDTYNAELGDVDLDRVTRPDAQGRPAAQSLVPMGFGDGGGGPAQVMLDRVRRMRDLDGLPRTRHQDPDAFFDGLDTDGLPTWRGDLYLETHRGVWTSQRETKLGDARCDEALRQAEAWAATAAVAAGTSYPGTELDGLWRRHLLLEFHDILPGSSITRVHREAEAEHEAILDSALQLRDSAIRALQGEPTRPRGTESPVTPPAPTPPGSGVLDNGLLRAEIGPAGTVTSLRDLRSGHELVPAGATLGRLRLFPDRPAVFDAWNIDRGYADAELPIPGPDGTGIGADTARATLGDSRAEWSWSLVPGQPRLRLRLEVDWRESDRLLRLSLPLAMRPAHLAAGVQHGLLERPLHENTSWEQARFEDWFQGYLHLSEGDLGVAVVTAHCHGYDARARRPAEGRAGTALGLSLVRAPGFPDPDCDHGRHEFVVDLLVGCDLDAATRAARAARADLIPTADHRGLAPLLCATGRGVMLDALKLADDGSGDVVVRLHESIGGRATAYLTAGLPLGRPRSCDLLERPVGPEHPGLERRWDVPLAPFEVRTLRFPMP